MKKMIWGGQRKGTADQGARGKLKADDSLTLTRRKVFADIDYFVQDQTNENRPSERGEEGAEYKNEKPKKKKQ